MNTRPGNMITEGDIAAYERDGVICLRNAFDRDWVDRMYTATDRVLNQPRHRGREGTKDGESGRFHINNFMSRWDNDFRAFIEESPAAYIAGVLTGAREARFFYDQLFVKEPRTATVSDWHQDLPYWPVRGEQIVSIWLALTPVTRESSGLQYAAGSHRWNKYYRPISPDRDPSYNRSDLELCPDFGKIEDPNVKLLSWDVEPGDVLVHHPLTAHGAAGNASATQRRLALSTRFMGDDVRWDPRPAAMKIEGDPQLRAGDPVVGDLFPVLWQKPLMTTPA
jgi:ectoine hydroxylase-related dioxygenase (phytanoyl-CoA dioxygenase family)